MADWGQEHIDVMRAHKICVLIPTYNNAGTIGRVVSETLRYTSDVLVVNDGSTDHTADILQSFGSAITIVQYPKNAGKGHALKVGFRKALEMGYIYAITMDSDGQHYPADLPKFVEAIISHPGALIIGERDLSKVDINGKSSFANKFSNFWFAVQTGCCLRDTQTGYRAYPLQKLHGLSCLTSRYEAELTLLVLAAWHGVCLHSIPIRVYYPPQAERVSHFKPFLDFTRISVLNTILCMAAVFYGLPVRIWNGLSQKRFFAHECKIFTYKRGKKREAAATLKRLLHSLYGMWYFIFCTTILLSSGTWFYAVIGRNSEKKKIRYHKLLQWASAYLVKRFPGAKTNIENEPNETFQTTALIICNHQSHLDIPILMSLCPKLIFLTNDWVWNSRFYGKIIRYAEFLPVSNGVDPILPQLRDLKNRGYSIVVFPEGTRSEDGTIARFHQGAFMLAQELDMAVLPMVLHGVGDYLPKKDFMFREGQITLKILPRVPRLAIEQMEWRKQASMFRQMIREEYDSLSQRKETADYFQSLVLYKYAYRGWEVVARCKRTLQAAQAYHDLINQRGCYKRVCILNSGIGTFALLYALVNKTTEVYAYDENIQDHKIAYSTVSLPDNLHYVHMVWHQEPVEENNFDMVLGLESRFGVGISSEKIESVIQISLKS